GGSFFFQAEDGIRDWSVTGVQTCALPISRAARIAFSAVGASAASVVISRETTGSEATGPNSSGWARSIATSARQSPPIETATARSEERRVGKEGRAREAAENSEGKGAISG